MIGFAAYTYDANGAIIADEHGAGTNLNEPTARISRSKTLDGGAYIDHSGVSDGDRTFTVAYPADHAETIYPILVRLYRNHTSVVCANRFGVFKGAIQDVKLNLGRPVVTFLAKEKLSAD